VDIYLDADIDIGLIALALAAYGFVAASLARASISGAFSFLVIGALIGGGGLGILVIDAPDIGAFSVLAELTLALVLFSAASTIRLRRLELDSGIAGRLLLIGLPLTIALGTVLALGMFPGISLGLALLIGTVLAPTDADLGHQVITDQSVPARIRRVLNVESGLNDGIAAPIVSVAIALAAFGDISSVNPILDAASELLIALAVGLVVGIVGCGLLAWAERTDASSPTSAQLATLTLAIAAYFLAAGLGASGFIAAFAAGLAFGTGNKARVEAAVAFTETQSSLLSILVWLVFGLILFDAHVLDLQDPMVVVYAILSLTMIRMVPVAIALAGARFDKASVAFMGWFGPRGLASVIFTLLALETLEGEGVSSGVLGPVVGWTVLLSVVAHGFSARPLARWYGRYSDDLPPDGPEFVGGDEEPRRAASMIHTHAGHQPEATIDSDSRRERPPS
jgi:NhaP-type Na+/H+ or K+/H+ antiporter